MRHGAGTKRARRGRVSSDAARTTSDLSLADVAQAVLYLLDADYVTGETIVVDGGRRVRN